MPATRRCVGTGGGAGPRVHLRHAKVFGTISCGVSGVPRAADLGADVMRRGER